MPLLYSSLDFNPENTSYISAKGDSLGLSSIAWRTMVFVTLEIGFYILSVTAGAYEDHIILNFPKYIPLFETKGGFTVLFIVWHMIAIFPAKDIPLYVFSAEWVAQYKRTGQLESPKTDRVSKLTTGIFGQARHWFSQTATTRYRLAMVLMVLFALLGTIGPGAIVVTSAPVDVPINIDVANVTFPLNSNTKNDTRTIFTRANSILRLELFENVTFGFESSDNLMIPWPSKQNNTSNGRVTYLSDVLSFNFSCTWDEPTVWKYSTEMNSISWKAQGKTFITNATDKALIHMPTSQTTSWSSWLLATYDTNSSSPNSPEFDLSGLPTTPRSEIEPKLNGAGFAVPQTVTALICNPQTKVYTALVTLDDGALGATRSDDHRAVGNIDSQKVLQDLFVSRLIPSLTHDFPDFTDGISSMTLNSVARLLLFCAENRACDTSFKPLPIPDINNNMNRFFRSASKAILDGRNGTWPGVNTFSVHNTFTTPATGQANRTVLAASKPVFSAFLVVFSATLLTLTYLVIVLKKSKQLLCFNLENVSRAILHELERSGTAPAHVTTSSLTLSAMGTTERID